MLESDSQNTPLEICPPPKTHIALRRSLALSKRRGCKRKVGPRYPNGQLRRHAPEDPPGKPTPQRFRHGAVAKVDIVDDHSRAVRPYRAASFLSEHEVEAVGRIDPETGKRIDKKTWAEMRAAGEDFRAIFYKAKLDPLGAAELMRSSRSTGGTEPDSRRSRIETARNTVWRAICAVGGLASLDGSCLWHVVGGERDLARWALEQGWIGRRISAEAAHSILISTLAALKEHELRA
jgi:hypothetical protein